MRKGTVYGAICGDIIGSHYEILGTHIKYTDFELFEHPCQPTDDTICTLAIASWLKDTDRSVGACQNSLLEFGSRFPDFGYGPMYGPMYGAMYLEWLRSRDPKPYNSYGNGSAMRVSPCALVAGSLEECLGLASLGTVCTHNHPEGLMGAWAVAECCWRALHKDPDMPEDRFMRILRILMEKKYGYEFGWTLEEIRPEYSFDCTCPGSVPYALEAFFESRSYEEAVRNAVSLGGDSDTLGAMAGSVAACMWGIPEEIIEAAKERMPAELVKLADEFDAHVQKLNGSKQE